MSYKKYIEIKENKKTEFSIEQYNNSLIEELSGLLMNPSKDRIKFVKNDTINELELTNWLEESQYPNSILLEMAVATHLVKKISQERKNLFDWASKNSNKAAEKINSMLLEYETSLYAEEINCIEIDKAINNYSFHSKKRVQELAEKIDKAVKNIIWHNHNVFVEALYPTPEYGHIAYLSEEAIITIGSTYKKQIKFKFENNEINEIPNKSIPEILQKDCNSLINYLKK